MTTIALESVRARLALIWFSGSGVFFLLLVAQSLGGLYGDQEEKAWAWAFPNIIPTLSLMLSVFAAYALIPRSEVDSFTVRTTFFWIAFGLSLFYFVILVAVVAAAPFSAARAGTYPVDVMHRSNFFLGPLQGLTAAALGALFFSKSKE
jgi:hypothetical protein